VGHTIRHIRSNPPTTRQTCRSKKSRTIAPPLLSRPQAARRRRPRNTPQLSRPGLRWRAGRAVATSRMYIVSNMNYRCALHGMSRHNAGSSPGSSQAGFTSLSPDVPMALARMRRNKPTRKLHSAGSSSCMVVPGRPVGHRARRRQAIRYVRAAAKPVMAEPTCNRFQTTSAHNENDGIAPSFPSRLGLQLEELNSLETARMRV
jgi:hypothetical protein